jgi:hypothetical protein
VTEHTPYQKGVIRRYYSHRHQIALARLGEMVGALYLADSDAKLDRLWGRVEKAMKTLEVPASVAEHILASRDPDVLARNVREWLRNTDKGPDNGMRP